MENLYSMGNGKSRNNQSPMTKLQLITNTQYSITKQRLAGIFSFWVFGHWSLGINW